MSRVASLLRSRLLFALTGAVACAPILHRAPAYCYDANLPAPPDDAEKACREASAPRGRVY